MAKGSSIGFEVFNLEHSVRFFNLATMNLCVSLVEVIGIFHIMEWMKYMSISICDFEHCPEGYMLSNREFEAEESGIEGILNRLEKYRSNSFGSGFRGKEDSTSSENNEDRDEWDHRTPANAVSKFYSFQML